MCSSTDHGNDTTVHQEDQYLNLVRKILNEGSCKDDRTGVGTLSIFGAQMRFNLSNDIIPLLTTKRVFWRGIVEEMLWFIRGSTDAGELSDKGVHIWDANGSREFLDAAGFNDRMIGDLGPVYGFQWRHFGATYDNMRTDYCNRGVDQLADIIRKIRDSPDDRRMILCAWNPPQLAQMALPPCHLLAQFYVVNNSLSCQMYMRSADMGLGVPFNIASYALLTRMIAHVTGRVAHELILVLGDAHIYTTHIKSLREQIKREPRPFPTLRICREVNDIDEFKSEDFELLNYNPHGRIDMTMAI